MGQLFHYRNFGAALPLAIANMAHGTSTSCARDALNDGDRTTDCEHVALPEHVEEEDLSIYVDTCVRGLARYGHWNGQPVEVLVFLKITLYSLAGCVVHIPARQRTYVRPQLNPRKAHRATYPLRQL